MVINLISIERRIIVQIDRRRNLVQFQSRTFGWRKAANKAAGALQEQNLISYSRGSLLIEDRVGLKAIACDCYGIIKAESDTFLRK